MWHVLNRFIAKTTRRNEYMASQKTAQEARVQAVQLSSTKDESPKRSQHRTMM